MLLWHERDISHSSAERVVLPDASIVADFALARMTDVIDRLVVNVDRMEANLASTRGLVFSQRVLLALVESGLSRDAAYRIVQRNAMEAWEHGTQLKVLLEQDPEVHLSSTTLDHLFDTSAFLRNAEAVFVRLSAVEL